MIYESFGGYLTTDGLYFNYSKYKKNCKVA